MSSQVTKQILNHLNEVVGEITLPSTVSENEWFDILAEYKKPPENPSYRILQATIEDRKKFAEHLIEKFKKKNLTEGINALQALYMHHTMRSLEVNFMGLPMVIDLMNLVISGDIEIACIALQNSAPHSMAEPYHWLSSLRIGWLVSEMKTYLGWPQ